MAGLIRMNKFNENGGGGGGAFDWWNEIDESKEWQQGLFYALCASYSLVSFIALVQLFRIQMRVPEYGWTTQKVFHLMNFIVNGLRAILFGLYKSVFLIRPKNWSVAFSSRIHFILGSNCSPTLGTKEEEILFQGNRLTLGTNEDEILFQGSRLNCIIFFLLFTCFTIASGSALEMILLDLPGLLFFSTYTLLVLFWAEIYHQARSLPIDRLRPVYLSINGVVYFLQVCIWLYLKLSHQPVAVEVAKLFFAVISFVAALGFIIYGGRLFYMLRRFPIESKGRRNKLNEVGFVTGICCTCFLIRCFVIMLSAFDKDADLDVLNHPLLNFIYYMLVEIIPSLLVLFILRKLPPKRVSDQYHPIR